MKKYKVLTSSVGGRRNKIFKAGDIVFENNFPEGNAEQLVKKGFLEKVGESQETDVIENIAPDVNEGQPEIVESETEETQDEQTSSDEESNEDVTNETGTVTGTETEGGNTTESETESESENEDESEESQETDEVENGDTFDKISISRLRKDLKKRKVPFDKNATKEALYTLWLMN
jgi:hypothetical protein